MKPRLRRAALTVEDFCISARVQCHLLSAQLMNLSGDSDNRDADLMLLAQKMRWLGFDLPIEAPSVLTLDWISTGGDLA